MARALRLLIALELAACTPAVVTTAPDLATSPDGPRAEADLSLDCGAACALDRGPLDACLPSCAGKACGHDGCGGFCGNRDPATQGCPTGEVCSSGACVPAASKSTVTVSGSAWVISKASGANAASTNLIADAALTLAISNPTLVSQVELSLHHPTTGWQPPVKTWSNPTGDLSHGLGLSTEGTWKVRAILTHKDGATVESNHHPIECRKKTLTVSASSTSPVLNTSVTLTAACAEGCQHAYAAAQWFRSSGSGWTPDAASNPLAWTASGTVSWLWQERFSDGSILNSSSVTVTPVAAPPAYDITPGTYSGATITSMMQGKASFTWQPGSYTITSQFFIPSKITITATGASIKLTGGSIKNDAPASCGVVGDNHYTHAGGFTWDGGTIYRDVGDTLMSFAHAPSLTIKNATFYRYCSSANTGHAIEINACGGVNQGTAAKAGTGPYTVRIVDNTFLGTDQGQRPNSNDEPIQYDWAYSTGAAGAKVCPNQSNVLASTMCHNVEISGNTFHRLAETGSWVFALCAIGGHKPADPISGTKRLPTNRHNNFLIANNKIHGAVGSTGTNPDKGAIHLFALRGVTVTGNTFFGCTSTRLVSYEIDGNAAEEVETTDLPYITSQVTPVHTNLP